MFGIGGFELFIILVFAFLIFGPDKLPEVAKTVGKAIARFRSAQEEMNSVIKSTDIFDPNDPEQPFKDPVEALDKLGVSGLFLCEWRYLYRMIQYERGLNHLVFTVFLKE